MSSVVNAEVRVAMFCSWQTIHNVPCISDHILQTRRIISSQPSELLLQIIAKFLSTSPAKQHPVGLLCSPVRKGL